MGFSLQSLCFSGWKPSSFIISSQVTYFSLQLSLYPTTVLQYFGELKLDTVLQLQHHMCQTEQNNHLPWPADYILAVIAQYTIGCLPGSSGFFLQNCFLPTHAASPQPGCCIWLSCKMSDFAFVFVELHEISVSTFLQPFWLPLKNSTALQDVNHSDLALWAACWGHTQSYHLCC